MRLSIIVPVLNEQKVICAFLGYARKAAPDAEIIVVDGGSGDRTAELAAGAGGRVISAPRGRGRQMNAGEAVASGDVLWFLHADSKISWEAVQAMRRYLAEPCNAGGCFSLRISPPRWIYRVRDFVGDYCVDLFGVALGDRGFFCRRKAFSATGGFAEAELFEDADFYRALRKAGPTRRLDAVIQTSSRRYETQGPLRTCIFYGIIMLLYWLAFPRMILESFVRGFSSRSHPVKKDASVSDSPANTVRRSPDSFPLESKLDKCLYEKYNP